MDVGRLRLVRSKEGVCEMVARALKRLVWDCCYGHCLFVGTGHGGKGMNETALVG